MGEGLSFIPHLNKKLNIVEQVMHFRGLEPAGLQDFVELKLLLRQYLDLALSALQILLSILKFLIFGRVILAKLHLSSVLLKVL